MERLQKVIADSGYCSRRKAELLIKEGKVKVNGNIVDILGTKVASSDSITVEGKMLNKDKNYVYYILNKPRGVISSTKDEKGRKTVVDLIDTKERIYPIGRLDYDSTGLLLLTNDGELANILMHPSNNIDKTYIVKLDSIISGYAVKLLKEGIKIDNTKVIPSRVKVRSVNKKTNSCTVEIVIHEGKNHEVKRLFEAVGYRVDKLKREKYAHMTLRGLNSGDYRHLTPKEVKQLYSL